MSSSYLEKITINLIKAMQSSSEFAITASAIETIMHLIANSLQIALLSIKLILIFSITTGHGEEIF